MQAEILKLGANVSAPPFIFIDGEGNYSGFDVELITEIGKLKGFTVFVIPEKYPDVFKRLEDKQLDIIGNVYFSQERQAKYLLSTPYYTEEFVFINLMNGNKDDVEALNAERLKVAVLSNSPLQSKLEDIKSNYQNIEIKTFLTGFLGFKSLFQKKSDIMLTLASEAKYYTGNRKGFTYKIFPIPEEYQDKIDIGFLSLRDNAELMERINSGMEELKRNGTYEKLIKKYNLE